MTRLVIFLLIGFATIALTSSFKNCSENNLIICGDTCATYGWICDCGEKSYRMGQGFVCISNSDCMLEKGKIKCDNGTIETEPFYHQGNCYVEYIYDTSVPCKSGSDEFTCSERYSRDYVCKGFSFGAKHFCQE